MDLIPNNFLKDLRAGRLQIGLWQALASQVCAEICAGAGFDWLLFDGEHGPNDLPTLLAQLQAVAPYPSHPVGRVPAGETWLIKQYLDIGFTTLLVPMVETPEAAAELVRAMRYPPDGMRGVASSIVRASRWGRVNDFLSSANSQTCLLVQIETRKGLENLEQIAAVNGVDGVFIGPADLAASLGHRGEPGHPEVQAQIERAIAALSALRKPVGILSADQRVAARYIELGCRFVAVGTDVSLLARGSRQLRAQFGDRKEDPPPRTRAY